MCIFACQMTFFMKQTTHSPVGPTTEKQRYTVLDSMRGLALLGIALANFPEFGLWTFLSGDARAAMPTAGIDKVVRFVEYWLVEGKFYSIFSILFGIGFSIFLFRHGTRRFVRRMLILLLIGLVHLLLIWNGDILLLYAVGGLLLVLFVRATDRMLLALAVFFILLPAGLDAWSQWQGIDMAAPLYDAWWRQAASSGITEANFASWLRDADSYAVMFEFLKQGSIERMWEFVSGHRLLKVTGLFLIGYLIGRHRLYAHIEEMRPQLKRAFFWTLSVMLPLSFVFAWSATHGEPWGMAVHSLLYAVSVVPLALAFMMGVCLWLRPFEVFKSAGRMALTCYIGQSLIGIFLFYGICLGWGTRFGFVHIELTAFIAFFAEVLVCRLWLRHFSFGPLEWLWRMLTYGKWMRLRKSAD